MSWMFLQRNYMKYQFICLKMNKVDDREILESEEVTKTSLGSRGPAH